MSTRNASRICRPLLNTVSHIQQAKGSFSPLRGSSFTTADASGNSFVASVILERLPVVLPELPAWEEEFMRFSFERQQQYRKEYPAEMVKMSSTASSEGEGDIVFEPAPRVTEADRTNDIKSLDRSLDRRLYFIIQGPGADSSAGEPRWHFPERQYASEDTMRQCAEGALEDHVGTSADVYFVGNAPCGHLPTQQASDVLRFFFKSQFLGGRLSLPTRISDYAWVTKQELLTYVDDAHQDLFKRVLLD